MAKLLTYNNVLDPLSRTTKIIEANNSSELVDRLDIDTNLYDVVISKNQIVMSEDFDIADDDCIAISIVPQGGGGGKDIVRTVALIAVMVAAPYAATYAAWGLGVGLSSTAFTVASAGFAIAGAMVVNSVLPPQTPGLGTGAGALENIENSPTYSWDRRGNQVRQGVPVPVLYGKHRVKPPIISSYVQTVDNKQYLNLLYAVADGITNIDTTSIIINDEPISNFKGVSVFVREGSLDQSTIPAFDDIKTDKSVNKKMSTEWITASTTGNSVAGLEVGLVAPQGLWYVSDEGKIIDYSVKIDVEYFYNNQWLPMQPMKPIINETTSSTQTVTQSSTTSVAGYWIFYNIFKYARYNTAEEAMRAYVYGDLYGDRAKYTELRYPLPDNTKVEYFTPPWFTLGGATIPISVQYIDYTTTSETSYDTITGGSQETLRRTYRVEGLPKGSYDVRARFREEPNTGSRYGSSMIFEYLQETVTDDFTYPNTALLGLRVLATDQLSGSLPRVSVVASNSIDNPADICKDILTRSGESLSDVETAKFDEWKQFCIDKGYDCNIYFDSTFTVKRALDLVALNGRGKVLQYGSKWSVIIDKADETPVQGFLFTMGNIVKDSFNEQFLPLQNRVNKIDITYYDKDAKYEPQILQVSNDNYHNVENVNSTSINYVGCTDKNKALKYARFLLNCSRYLTITQSFEVDTEAIVCRVGDVIKVAHDVPAIGLISGKIVSGTTSTVTLDNNVSLEAGEVYYIDLRYSDTDEIITKQIVNSETTTNVLTFTQELTKAPSAGDVFSFGQINKVTKKMRITSIVTSSNNRSKITALEYVNDVYNDSLDIIPHSESDFDIRGLELNEAIRYKNTSVISDINASWRGSSLYYNVYINGEFYEKAFNDFITIPNLVAPKTYNIKIVDSFGTETERSISLLGRFAPPEPPTEFKAIQHSDIVRFSWDKSIALDVSNYEIRHGITWETGTVIGRVGNVDTFEWNPDMNQTYRFWIKALDYSNVYSETAVEYQLNVQNIEDTLNVIINLDMIDVDTAPCGTTSGLVFITGLGYIPIATSSFEDLSGLSFEDVAALTFGGGEVWFESCAVDTVNTGLTKIRMLSNYTSTATGATFSTFPARVFGDFPFDSFGNVTAPTSFKMYYAISNDDITYSSWIEYTGIVDESFRYIKFKYEFLDDLTGIDVTVNDFKAILDVPDIEYDIINKSITNSEAITFSSLGLEFYETPRILVANKGSTVISDITSLTKTGFTISLYDTTGTLTSGTVDISIKGY